jgi:hypothetical protein
MDIDLKIDLSVIPNKIYREQYYEESRERLTCEKYFRQAIMIYNKEQKWVNSGFIQINDYTNMCQMVRVCNPYKKNLHFCEKWEHYGSQMNKTDEHTICDFSTGNMVGTVKSEYVSGFVKTVERIINDVCCMVDDLKRDQYSEILLECLNEYSDANRPSIDRLFAKKDEESLETCECNLLELLNISEQFNDGEIDEYQKKYLIDALKCRCGSELEPIRPELTEEEKANREIMKQQAKQEIKEVFALNGIHPVTQNEVQCEQLIRIVITFLVACFLTILLLVITNVIS